MSLHRTPSKSLLLAFLVATLVCSTSAVAGASQPDTLARSLPSPREFARDPGALAAALGATPSRSRFFGPDRSSVAFTFPQAGSPYKGWYVELETERGKVRLEIETARDQSTHSVESYQAYVWGAVLPASDVHVGPRLQSFSIHTGSDLGAHGSIDLDLGASSVKTRVVRCHKTGTKLAVESHGRGALEGDFSFHPGESFLPATVKQTSVKARMGSIHSTHHHCGSTHPRGSTRGHGGFVHCSSQKFFTVADGSGSRLNAWLIRNPYVYLVHVGPTVGLVHSFWYGAEEGPQRLVDQGHGAITIDASNVGGLFDGSITFTPTSETVRGPKGCERHDVRYGWYGGTLGVNFDAGRVALHGSGLDADVRWLGHAIKR